MGHETQWRVIDGIVATCGAILLLYALLAGEWFTALTAVVVGGTALYSEVTGESLLKWRYKKVDSATERNGSDDG